MLNLIIARDYIMDDERCGYCGKYECTCQQEQDNREAPVGNTEE